jgi:putative polymerase
MFARTRVWVGCGLVVAATTFNMVLCFFETRGLALRQTHVIGSEIIIISLAAVVSYRFFLDTRILSILLLFLAYYCAMWLITDTAILKTIRDFLIPVVFVALGYTSAKPEIGDKVLYFLIIVVLVMALFEWLFPDSFTDLFDIRSYYAATRSDSVDAGILNWPTKFYFTSFRVEEWGTAQGFHLFGEHRISSLFLEPLGLGQFAVVSLTWLWVRRRAKQINWLFIGICALLILMCDVRFGMYTAGILFVAGAIAVLRSRMVIFIMPFVCMSILVLIAWIEGDSRFSMDLIGRLVGSGQLLKNIDITEWFGGGDQFNLGHALFDDAGYAYAITRLGILGCVALWALFSISNPKTKLGTHLKTLVAIYLCLEMCIGAQFLSIKTAALLWFLYGASQSPRSGEEEELTFEQAGQLSPVGVI